MIKNFWWIIDFLIFISFSSCFLYMWLYHFSKNSEEVDFGLLLLILGLQASRFCIAMSNIKENLRKQSLEDVEIDENLYDNTVRYTTSANGHRDWGRESRALASNLYGFVMGSSTAQNNGDVLTKSNCGFGRGSDSNKHRDIWGAKVVEDEEAVNVLNSYGTFQVFGEENGGLVAQNCVSEKGGDDNDNDCSPQNNAGFDGNAMKGLGLDESDDSRI